MVKPEFARELHQRLKAVGSPAVLLELPWAEHGFDFVFQGIGNREALKSVDLFLAWALK